MEAITTIGKNGVLMEEYKGEISLISTREGTNGVQYKQYATYQMGKDKHADKDWPVKVSLGDRKTAIGVLQMLLKELSGTPAPPIEYPGGPLPEDKVPF